MFGNVKERIDFIKGTGNDSQRKEGGTSFLSRTLETVYVCKCVWVGNLDTNFVF